MVVLSIARPRILRRFVQNLTDSVSVIFLLSFTSFYRGACHEFKLSITRNVRILPRVPSLYFASVTLASGQIHAQMFDFSFEYKCFVRSKFEVKMSTCLDEVDLMWKKEHDAEGHGGDDDHEDEIGAPSININGSNGGAKAEIDHEFTSNDLKFVVNCISTGEIIKSQEKY